MTDYRTATTGITPAHLSSGKPFLQHKFIRTVFTPSTADAWTFGVIQNYVSNFFRGKILVGHSLWNDLAGKLTCFCIKFIFTFFFFSVLGLPHPAVDTRDVALYQVRRDYFYAHRRLFNYFDKISPFAMPCVLHTRLSDFKP